MSIKIPTDSPQGTTEPRKERKIPVRNEEATENKTEDPSAGIYDTEEEENVNENPLPNVNKIQPKLVTNTQQITNEHKTSSNSNTNTNMDGWIDLTEKQDGGLLKKILVEGNGESPRNGSNVFCHYVGTLDSNGKKFDSSRDRNTPFNFPIGQGKVIKGWDIGIKTMKIGEQCILKCRSDYAYGDSAQGSIPSGATLNFEVELLSFDEYNVMSDCEFIKKKLITEGFGNEYEHPSEFGSANISYVGRLNDKNGNVFCKGSNVQICVNDDTSFCEGFHLALKDMISGEVSEFIVLPDKAYGEKGNKEYNIAPDTNVFFRITLNHFDNPKSEYEMTREEHFIEASLFKESGNESFKNGEYNSALKRYLKAVEILKHDVEFEESDKMKAKEIILKLNGNISLSYYKMKEFGNSCKYANDILETEPNNIKALIRRGQSRMYLGNFNDAKSDFKECIKLEPNNQLFKKLLLQNKKRHKEYNEKQRKLYQNAFGGKSKNKTKKKKTKNVKTVKTEINENTKTINQTTNTNTTTNTETTTQTTTETNETTQTTKSEN